MTRKTPPFPGQLTFQWVDRPFTTKTGHKGCQRVRAVVLTPEQREWFIRWFPEEENSRLMKATGMKHSTFHRFARELHLTKSAAGIRRIRKRQAAHVKRLCEKNGYYDSLRGRQPSEQCRQATVQMWQDIREGRREHPASIMRRQNPRKYALWMQRKSASRKDTIRRETQRAFYGLERKTRLQNVVLAKYTRSQTCHRYNAIRRGYILMADSSEQGGERYNIYYDADTQRTPKFERNLIADGFHLKPWTE